MDQDQIAVGMQVRYPRTGTTGAVVSLTTIRGDLYAEVEATHLLYRVDQLIAAEAKAQTGEEKKQDIRTILEKEREALTRLDGSQIETDNSCEGGG